MALEDTLVDIDGKLCRLEMATDITDQKMAIHELKNQLTAEEALVHCIQTLTLESDMKLAIDRLLENICKFYAGSRAYIFEYEFENKIIKNTYEWCAEGVSHEIENLQNIPIEYIAGWNRMFAERGEFFITSLSGAVSYTHLDVYKRQLQRRLARGRLRYAGLYRGSDRRGLLRPRLKALGDDAQHPFAAGGAAGHRRV